MKIVLGVTGGIAAYKMADLASVLVNKSAYEVQVVMTEAAKRIITPMTMATMSHRPILDDTREWSGDGHIWHIEMAKWADMFLVCPATANTITKMAQGVADNVLTSIYMALPAKTQTIIFPAMNTKMWEAKQNQDNISILEKRPYNCVIYPEVGLLACGDTGIGKLPSIKTIVEHIGEQIIIMEERARIKNESR
jgi:phosphopantothenoylcysteine synthetase/decarboxylase